MRRPRRRSRLSSSLLLELICLLAFAGSGRAQAPRAAPIADNSYLTACQKSPECSRHLVSATRFYDQARYSEALAEYQAAYQLQPYPLILFNIARLHHKQNHLAEAASYYQRYLDTADGERAERAVQLLAEAKREQAAPAPASPPPLPPAAVSPVPPPVSPPGPVSPVAVAPASTKAALRSDPLYKRWWLWTLVGVAVAGGATAVGLGVYARGPDTSGLPAKTLSFGN